MQQQPPSIPETPWEPENAQYPQYVCPCGLTMVEGRPWGLASSAQKLERHQRVTGHEEYKTVWIRRRSRKEGKSE